MATSLLCFLLIILASTNASECPPTGSTLHIPQDVVCANGHPECADGQEAWTLAGCGCGCKRVDDADSANEDDAYEDDAYEDTDSTVTTVASSAAYAAESDVVLIDVSGDVSCPPPNTTTHIPQDVVCAAAQTIQCGENQEAWIMTGCGCGCRTVDADDVDDDAADPDDDVAEQSTEDAIEESIEVFSTTDDIGLCQLCE